MDGVKRTIREILKDKKSHRRWLSVFLLLALLVSLSTVALLTMPSLAWAKDNIECCCPCAVHQHTEACLDENGHYCCPEAVAHLHNELCYDDNGELICPLPEIEPHEHVDSCYGVQVVLNCGLEESEGHQHTEDCYAQVRGALICENTDEDHEHTDECYEWTNELICGMAEGEGAHTHTDACYVAERVLTCTLPVLPVHVHSEECFALKEPEETEEETEAEEEQSDPTADLETAANWLLSVGKAALTGDWSEDLLAVAGTQLGYHESERNYQTVNGVRKGYTRYGAWYGAPYEDWCAMFVSFCLHYAQIPTKQMPQEANCNRWIELLKEKQRYVEILAPEEETPDPADETEEPGKEPYLPEPGDLIFFRMLSETGSDHVGIVCDTDEKNGLVFTVEGNSDNEVAQRLYKLDDVRIVGYGLLPEEPDAVRELEATYLDADGSYRVTVSYHPAAGIPRDAVLCVTKPGTWEYASYLEQTAEALGVSRESLDTLLLFDITILSGGEEIQPKCPVSVSIRPDTQNLIEDPQVVHFGDEPELLESQTVDGEIQFETEGFSVYGIVGTTIEQTVLSSDGSTYHVTVTYGDDAGVPAGSTLWVEELSESSEQYQELISRSETALGWDEGTVSYARLFDIKILDPDGQKVILAAPVDVRIELEGGDALVGLRGDPQVVHFADGAEEGDVLGTVTVEDETVRFEAEGFSAYAIVNGPGVFSTSWLQIQTMQDFLQCVNDGNTEGCGLYICHADGYYFTNTIKPDRTGNFTPSNNPSNRTGITRTAQSSTPSSLNGAVRYYFEPSGESGKYYIYCYGDSNTRQYVRHQDEGSATTITKSLSFTDRANATAFTVETQSIRKDDKDNQPLIDGFCIRDGNWYWNRQGGKNGTRFCAWNALNYDDLMLLWKYNDIPDDAYGLDGRTYGLMSYADGLTGKALMAENLTSDSVVAIPMNVLANESNRDDILFVPKDSSITRWTFHSMHDDHYTITAQVEGATVYLKIDSNGVYVVDEATYQANPSVCEIQVVPGSGAHAGEICLRGSSGGTLTYSGAINTGFFIGGTVGSEWLHFVEESLLTPEYYMVYSADKVSISDRVRVPDGAKVIVYTRVWNETRKRYDFYAIDHDGTLFPVYESGDEIQWFGNRLNTLLWDFTEYHWEGTNDPNYYYELYNEYSQQYLAPQVVGTHEMNGQTMPGQILSDDTIGIHLNGRRNGYFYSTILAWDDANYAYAGIRAHVGSTSSDRYIEACQINEATDFYFAIVHDLPTDDHLTEVATVDNNQYGITMRMVNFNDTTTAQPNGSGGTQTTSQQQHEVMGDSTGGAVQYAREGLLSNELGPNGYPIATVTGKSMEELFGSATVVNHLFIQSTLEGTGYFEYDSTQNFATLRDGDLVTNEFTVFQELASHDHGNKPSLRHGQFLPYDDIEPGNFCVTNDRNLYTATLEELARDDPRKNERLYKIEDPDYYFGMELTASFDQTPSGKDAWGHDIIYEFTGDDDFWLYVDGELIIDLGGIHSALAGNVNYCTGDVMVNGTHTTLYEIFRDHYIERYKAANNGAAPSQAEIDAYLIGTAANNYEDGIFEDDGTAQHHMIFKDYTRHEMKIYFMERGAGASNLYMRFNLSSVKPGTVLLSKQLEGMDSFETVEAEFPYQIWYQKEEGGILQDYRLNNTHGDIYVFYKDTITPVHYEATHTVGGIVYNDVFLISPGEIAEIRFPDDTIRYKIIECGVDKTVYDSVTVTSSRTTEPLTETAVTPPGGGNNRYDYSLDYVETAERTRVIYTNHIKESAMRSLTIRKRLYAEDGVTEIHHDDPIFGVDSAIFGFRLYFRDENAEILPGEDGFQPANMRSYHVKDNNGNYCYWDASQVKFVSLGETVFNNLSAADKIRATFHTSMNGSISKIPVDYDVEIREVLAGTDFRVVERDSEIPDGYSRRDYTLSYGSTSVTTETAPEGTMPSGETDPDPHVDVNNIRGWGLRVNKVWADDAFMDSRDPIYVAIFLAGSQTPFEIREEVDDGNGGTIMRYTSTVRRLDNGVNTMYWYLPHLAEGTTLDQYVVREVVLTNPAPSGETFTYDAIDRIDDNETITVGGVLSGFSTGSSFTYTATNTQGVLPQGSNIRTDTITNSRPGITLYKTDWDGNALANAQFTLSCGNATIGPFTSDASGLVDTLYLGEDTDYLLNEISAPQGYYGIETPLTLRLTVSGGTSTLTVTPAANAAADIGDYYVLNQNGVGGMPQLSVKNRTYTLRFDKMDGDTLTALPGVTFALHREVTVNGITDIDFTPIAGYENLVTNANGVIPGLDQTLPSGVYYLEETAAASGYIPMTGYLRFSVGPKGAVEILTEGRENWLSKRVEDDTIIYTMSVPNVRELTQITLQKVGYDNRNPSLGEYPVTGAVFNIYEADGTTLLVLNGVTQQNLTDNGNGVFFSGGLAPGTYYIEEVSAPPGYAALLGRLQLTISGGNATLQSTWVSGDPTHSVGTTTGSQNTGFTMTIRNFTGYVLPNTGGIGTLPLNAIGAALVLFSGAVLLLRRRKKQE